MLLLKFDDQNWFDRVSRATKLELEVILWLILECNIYMHKVSSLSHWHLCTRLGISCKSSSYFTTYHRFLTVFAIQHRYLASRQWRNRKPERLTRTRVPANSKTLAASSPAALMRAMPSSPWIWRSLEIPGSSGEPTYGGFRMWSGTVSLGDTLPRRRRGGRLTFSVPRSSCSLRNPWTIENNQRAGREERVFVVYIVPVDSNGFFESREFLGEDDESASGPES